MSIPEDLPWKPVDEETLGSGGQGTILIVTHEEDLDEGIKYALKVLDKPGDRRARKRFQDEIEAIKSLDHASIIRVFDHSEIDDDFQFYVMEYFEGARSLDKICLSSEPNPFHGDTLKSLDLFEQIIKAISVCEQLDKPLFHRDISPRNILLLSDGSIRLIDFGLCQKVGDNTITYSGENIGTRNYAPPECGAGSQLEIGTYTDIYSAAKVLWSIVTSEGVFEREGAITTNKSMEKMFPLNRETWHLNRIFRRAIQYEPDQRFQKAEQVQEKINEIRRVVKGGFPPLEAVKDYCPSCGLKGVRIGKNGGRQAFDTLNLFRTYRTFECTICGFSFIRRHETLEKSIEEGF
ncbi:MAG: serine/threonine-protein kinase [Caldilineaceae bacterium]|nr:serine/threonine-protein kinase [Caldilineaceae bacterium]